MHVIRRIHTSKLDKVFEGCNLRVNRISIQVTEAHMFLDARRKQSLVHPRFVDEHGAVARHVHKKHFIMWLHIDTELVWCGAKFRDSGV